MLPFAAWPSSRGVHADFRRDNGKLIRNVYRRLVMLCRELKIFTETVVVINGSKFKSVDNRDRNFIGVKIDRCQEHLELSIQRYLDGLERADRTQSVGLQAKTEPVEEKVERLRQLMRQLEQIREALKTEPDGQLSMTDPEARAMATSSSVIRTCA